MSYLSITQSTRDANLRDRVQAAMSKEAWHNPELSQTDLGQAVRQASGFGLDSLLWPCCVDFEAAYEYALTADNPDPGGDPSVITDADILSAVQANWPLEKKP